MYLLFKKLNLSFLFLKNVFLENKFFLITCLIFFNTQLILAQKPLSDLNLNRNISELELAPVEKRLSFSDVAKKILPSVVSIYCTKIVKTNNNWENQLDGSELRDFFGEKYFSFPTPREFRQKGSGSGIIVSNDGCILTNLHVVDNAELILVKLSDNRSFNATLKGVDPLTELAVIKISETDLPVAKFGDSDSIKIGEWVLAVGNPLELRSTVTAGIISAIGREVDIIDDNFGVENFIQTDATINPGSSGGALVNLSGKVIGINTAIATQSGYYEGYGFAIPSNLARQIMDDLIKVGYVVRSYLGVSMQDVNEKIARAVGFDNPQGVFIDQVSENSPASDGGLQEKDVLIKIDGKIINQGNVVQSLIAQKKPGESLLLTVIRQKKLIEIKIILGARPSSKLKMTQPIKKKQYHNFGLKVKTISRSMAEELGQAINYGIIVVEVEQFSPAFEANIHVNDIILEINDNKMTSQYVFEKLVSNLTPGTVSIFKMKRQHNIFHRFIEIQL